jgi:hypothetical protein
MNNFSFNHFKALASCHSASCHLASCQSASCHSASCHLADGLGIFSEATLLRLERHFYSFIELFENHSLFPNLNFVFQTQYSKTFFGRNLRK